MSREIRKNYWTTKLSAGCKYEGKAKRPNVVDRLFPMKIKILKIIYCCDDRFSK